jgi:hypothetical protein
MSQGAVILLEFGSSRIRVQVPVPERAWGFESPLSHEEDQGLTKWALRAGGRCLTVCLTSQVRQHRTPWRQEPSKALDRQGDSASWRSGSKVGDDTREVGANPEAAPDAKDGEAAGWTCPPRCPITSDRGRESVEASVLSTKTCLSLPETLSARHELRHVGYDAAAHGAISALADAMVAVPGVEGRFGAADRAVGPSRGARPRVRAADHRGRPSPSGGQAARRSYR